MVRPTVAVLAAALGVMLSACDHDRGEPAPAREAPPRPAPEARPARAEPPSPEPSAPLLDPRAVLLEPGAHAGEERVCHVAFADRVTEVRGRERERYAGLPVTRRRAVTCATDAGRGWADLVVRQERADLIDRIESGTLARVQVAMPHGGFADYTVLELVAVEGSAPPPPEPPEPSDPEPGFDFSRAGEPGIDREPHACGVGFTGQLEIVDDRMRARHSYAEDVALRLPVKCVHEGGESWVDLVFARGDHRALGIERGRTISLRIVAPAGGYADRPVVRLDDAA